MKVQSAAIKLVATFIILALSPAYAQSLKAVAPLQGYACMALNRTPEEISGPKPIVSYYDAPSPSAHAVGWAASIVLVRTPQITRNGYLEALFPNGKTVWIKDSDVRPWHNPHAPAVHCYPQIMSDGFPGFMVR